MAAGSNPAGREPFLSEGLCPSDSPPSREALRWTRRSLGEGGPYTRARRYAGARSVRFDDFVKLTLNSIEELVVVFSVGDATMKSIELVSVSTFRSMADAQIAKGVLDEVEIDSTIRADNAGGMYPAIGGAELLVRSEDVDRANEALHRRHRRSD